MKVLFLNIPQIRVTYYCVTKGTSYVILMNLHKQQRTDLHPTSIFIESSVQTFSSRGSALGLFVTVHYVKLTVKYSHTAVHVQVQ